MSKTHTAEEVANYFLAKSNEGKEVSFTHLQIQKLIYFAAGLFIAEKNRPLFHEEIQAW